MLGLNSAQIFDILRSLGVMALSYLVGNGTLTSDQSSDIIDLVEQAAPAVGALGLMAYGVYKKRAAAVAQQADQIPGVTVSVSQSTAPPAVVEAAKKQDNGIKISA